MTKPTDCYSEPLATELEEKRVEKRLDHRITYDCFFAYCANGYVRCRLNDKIILQTGRNGGWMTLYDCLYGRTSVRCLKCANFDTE